MTILAVQQIRTALACLHDPAGLEAHPLAGRVGGARGLRRALEDAIAGLRPHDPRVGVRAARRHDLLRLRYLEALPVDDVLGQLSIGRSEYYREHDRALAALTEMLPPGLIEARGAPAVQIATVRSESHLPRALSSFVGRANEVADVRRLLGSVRLLTMSGAPGTGKTRLALQIAGEHTDPVVFVALGAISDPDAVVSALAMALGVQVTPGRSALEGVVSHLANRRLLLVLDNFEQVIAAGPAIVTILGQCPAVSALITSREPLHVSGEHVYALAPLNVPESGVRFDVDQLLDYDAVRLFVDRARAASSSFVPNDHDLEAIADICRRLDGLPLAIELAAARVRILPPRALHARLERALPVLTGGPRDVPDRQRTLRAAIEWSYGLLDDDERALFRLLGVFAGGASLEAVEAISRDSSVLDRLSSLVQKSVLERRATATGEPRFVMLATVREYALEKLAAADELDDRRRDHAEHMVRLAEASSPEVLGGTAPGRNTPRLLDRLEEEQENLRAALTWAVETGEVDLGLRMVGALNGFWMWRGSRSEARAWAKRLLAMSTTSVNVSARVRALVTAAVHAWMQGEPEPAQALGEEALALARSADDHLGQILAYKPLCFVAVDRADFASARRHLAESMALARGTGVRAIIAFGTYWLGNVAAGSGDSDSALGLYEEALEGFRADGEIWGQAIVLWSLSRLALARGDQERAEALCREGLEFVELIRDQGGMADARCWLAILATGQGDFATARPLYAASLPALRDQVAVPVLLEAFRGVALLAARTGAYAAALRLTSASATLRSRLGVRSMHGHDYHNEYVAQTERALDAARLALGPEEAEAAWSAGATMSVDEAVAEAIDVAS